MSRLPLSVVGGYLGAGKTTLINRLLAADHGLRLAVLVNDFGAINIDAALLRSAREDTIELTNGCVCCTMTGDLFYAVGDMLDRRPRPDHLIVEASGISDPAKIAAVALAEPELAYAGVLTVIDGVNFPAQRAAPQLRGQLLAQARAADILAVSKVPLDDTAVSDALRDVECRAVVGAGDTAAVAALLFGGNLSRNAPAEPAPGHANYAQWSSTVWGARSKADIEARLACRPPGVLRLKALIPDVAGGLWEVHVVGDRSDVVKRPGPGHAGVVAIGLEGAVTVDEIETWWNSGVAVGRSSAAAE